MALGLVRGLAQEVPISIVTTLFPLYDWAREVGGPRVKVTQLLPPGVETHTYAPRPSDIRILNRAHVFLYLGRAMEPWANDLLKGVHNPHLVVIEAGREVMREMEDEPNDPSHRHGASDPHVWLDPVLAQDIVSAIAEGLAQADPDGRAIYLAHAAGYRTSLQALHEKISAGLAHCRHRQILYAGHFAFGHFARRYGLTHVSPYPGFSPNAAPTPAQMASLIRTLRETGQTTLFHEELLDPRIGRILAAETGVRLVLLHGAHNLTREERARGNVTYLSLMEDNLAKLREALQCP